MSVCAGCKSYRIGKGTCEDGFIQGGYPNAVPQCLRDNYADGNPHFTDGGEPMYYSARKTKDTTNANK